MNSRFSVLTVSVQPSFVALLAKVDAEIARAQQLAADLKGETR